MYTNNSLTGERRMCRFMDSLSATLDQAGDIADAAVGSGLQGMDRAMNRMDESLKGFDPSANGDCYKQVKELHTLGKSIDEFYGRQVQHTFDRISEFQQPGGVETRFAGSPLSGMQMHCNLPGGIDDCSIDFVCCQGPRTFLTTVDVPVMPGLSNDAVYVLVPREAVTARVNTAGDAGKQTTTAAVPRKNEVQKTETALMSPTSDAQKQQQELLKDLKTCIEEFAKMLPQLLAFLGVKQGGKVDQGKAEGSAAQSQSSSGIAPETQKSVITPEAMSEALETTDIEVIKKLSDSAQEKNGEKITRAFTEVQKHYIDRVKDKGEKREKAFELAARKALEEAGFSVLIFSLPENKLQAFYKKGTTTVKVAVNAPEPVVADSSPDTDKREKIEDEVAKKMKKNLHEKLDTAAFRSGTVTIRAPEGEYGKDYLIEARSKSDFFATSLKEKKESNGDMTLSIPDSLKNTPGSEVTFILKTRRFEKGSFLNKATGFATVLGFTKLDERTVNVGAGPPPTPGNSPGPESKPDTEAKDHKNIELAPGFTVDSTGYEYGSMVLTLPKGKLYGQDVVVMADRPGNLIDPILKGRIREDGAVVLHVPPDLRNEKKMKLFLVKSSSSKFIDEAFMRFLPSQGGSIFTPQQMSEVEKTNAQANLQRIAAEANLSGARFAVNSPRAVTITYKGGSVTVEGLVGNDKFIIDELQAGMRGLVTQMDKKEEAEKEKKKAEEAKNSRTKEKDTKLGDYNADVTAGIDSGNDVEQLNKAISALATLLTSKPSAINTLHSKGTERTIADVQEKAESFLKKGEAPTDTIVKDAVQKTLEKSPPADVLFVRGKRMYIVNPDVKLQALNSFSPETASIISPVWNELKRNIGSAVRPTLSNPKWNGASCTLQVNGKINITNGSKTYVVDLLHPSKDIHESSEATRYDKMDEAFEKALQEVFGDAGNRPERLINLLNNQGSVLASLKRGELYLQTGGTLYGSAVTQATPILGRGFLMGTGGVLANVVSNFPIAGELSTPIMLGFEGLLERGNPKEILQAMMLLNIHQYADDVHHWPTAIDGNWNQFKVLLDTIGKKLRERMTPDEYLKTIVELHNGDNSTLPPTIPQDVLHWHRYLTKRSGLNLQTKVSGLPPIITAWLGDESKPTELWEFNPSRNEGFDGHWKHVK